MDKPHRHPKALSAEATAYGEALRQHFMPLSRRGITQRELASAAHICASQVTRYFNGEKVAPKTFLTHFERFLAANDMPLAREQLLLLHTLRTGAEAITAGSSGEVARIRNQLDQVQALLDKDRKGHQHTRQHLARHEADTVDLGRKLRGATAERDLLRARTGELRDQLEELHWLHGQLKDDYTVSQQELRLLREEVTLLRRQVEALTQDRQGRGNTPLAETTTQVSHTIAEQRTPQPGTPTSPLPSTTHPVAGEHAVRTPLGQLATAACAAAPPILTLVTTLCLGATYDLSPEPPAEQLLLSTVIAVILCLAACQGFWTLPLIGPTEDWHSAVIKMSATLFTPLALILGILLCWRIPPSEGTTHTLGHLLLIPV